MSVILSPPMVLQFQNPNSPGNVLAGGKLFTYIAGTSTKQATWTDSSQSVQNANPIILDSTGSCVVWVDPTLTYKYVLAPANDTDPPSSALRTVDNIQGGLTIGTLPGVLGLGTTAAETLASVTVVNTFFAPGNILRYGTNTTPGTTDMTSAIQAAINQASRGGAKVRVPQGTYAITQDLLGTVGTFPLQGGTGPFAIDIEGEGREQTLIQAISGGVGFTNAMLYFNATPFRLAGSVTGIRFDGGALTTDGVVFVGCDMPHVFRCWFRNCVGRGLWFNNCIMPTEYQCYTTACGTATKAQVEYISCTIGRRFQSYSSSGNGASVGGLACDQVTDFTMDGGNCESSGTCILIDSKSNTVGSVGVTLRNMDLENPGNGNRYIDIGAGLTGGGLTKSIDIGGWTGSPSGTTTMTSAVRLQNVSGARLRQANFALPGSPTVSYELAGTASTGVVIEAHPQLTGVIPWVFVNGSQVIPASPLYDWTQGITPRGYGDLTTSLNGATPSVLINATIGGYYGAFNMNNGGATTVTNLSGGTNGMRISIRFTNGNTTLTNGTGSGQFNLNAGANVTPATGSIWEFVAIGGNWVQPHA